MRLRKPLFVIPFLLLLCAIMLPAEAKDAPRSFSLSTSRTFAPGESVKIQLLARECAGAGIPRLQGPRYREVLCRTQGPAQLWRCRASRRRSRSTSAPGWSGCTISRRDLWWRVRHFFRGQFADEARDSFREGQGKLGKRSKVVGATQFAQRAAAQREPAGGALEADNAAGAL